METSRGRCLESTGRASPNQHWGPAVTCQPEREAAGWMDTLPTEPTAGPKVVAS